MQKFSASVARRRTFKSSKVFERQLSAGIPAFYPVAPLWVRRFPKSIFRIGQWSFNRALSYFKPGPGPASLYLYNSLR